MTGPPDDDAMLDTAAVAPMIGATYRQLDHWLRTGAIPGPPLQGSGNRRRWTRRQVETARIAARLVSAGMAPVVAGRLAALGPGTYELADGVTVTITTDMPDPEYHI